MSNQEDLILDQLENDIRLASETGHLDTEQYTITFSNGKGVLHDKIHDEETEVIDNGSVLELRDSSEPKPASKSGDKVMWTDSIGDSKKGVLMSNLGDGRSLVGTTSGCMVIPSSNVKSIDNKVYSKTRSRYYLIDRKGNIKAFGHLQSLGALAKKNPEWMLKQEYELNSYLKRLEKTFSGLSEENQRLFTRPYRRFAVLDANKKLVSIVDVTNAKGLVMKNPGWSMVRERDYNKSHQLNETSS